MNLKRLTAKLILSLIALITLSTFAQTTLTFQEGQNSYTGNTCCTLQAGNPLGRIIDWRWYSFGLPQSSAAIPGLMRFENIFGSSADQIPADVMITSAKIKLYLEGQWGSNDDQHLKIYPLLKDWERTTACWSYRAHDGTDPTAYWGDSATATSGPQADIDYDSSKELLAEFSGSTTDSWITVDITDIFNEWYSGNLTNYGIIAFGDSTYQGIFTRSALQGSLAPILEVTYEPITYATVTYQEGQNGYTGNSCCSVPANNPLSRIIDWRWYAFGLPQSSAATPGLMRFDNIIGNDVAGIPYNTPIQSAKVHLYLQGQWGSTDDQTLKIYPLLKDWERTTACWSYRGYDGSNATAYWGDSATATSGPQAGIDYDSTREIIADFSGSTTDSWITVDITSIFSDWTDGTIPNYGFIAFGDSTYQGIYTRSASQGALAPILEVTYADTSSQELPAIDTLTITGDQFINSRTGEVVKLWGVNTVAFYPTHTMADNYVETLAERGVNYVRWHHMLRSSLDWNPKSQIEALVTYSGDTSRILNSEALDRFDYLNAKLKEYGIYVSFSTRWSRKYLAEDASILTGATTEDENAWKAAIADLNSRSWTFNLDKNKFLPVFDERCALIDKEFIGNILTHENPYTGVTYGDDPQVISLEVINEYSAEYAIICHHDFYDWETDTNGSRLYRLDTPLGYFGDKLVALWDQYCLDNSITQCDLYGLQTTAQKEGRSDFLDGLDRTYFQGMKDYISSLGYNKAMVFSTCWRGERPLKLNADMNDYIESHAYVRAEVTDTNEDWLKSASKMAIQDLPFVLGELNQREWTNDDTPTRTMMPASLVTYGLLQGWSGVAWFAMNHGDRSVLENGLGDPDASDSVTRIPDDRGDLITDQAFLDHLRAAGLIFKRQLFQRSTTPKTVCVDENLARSDWDGLMTDHTYQNGWQSIYEIRKKFAAKPADQNSQDFMTAEPTATIITSDTGEIVKDLNRNQLTAAATEAEVFSGTLDTNPPANLQHLEIDTTSGFATVMLVTEDEETLSNSQFILLSRTYVDTTGLDVAGPDLTLNSLATPETGKTWIFRDELGNSQVLTSNQGTIVLPSGTWRECELTIE